MPTCWSFLFDFKRADEAQLSFLTIMYFSNVVVLVREMGVIQLSTALFHSDALLSQRIERASKI